MKYWPHTMIEVVATPSVTMCTSSQRDCGIHGFATATMSRATSHPDTGRDALRCQLRLFVSGLRPTGADVISGMVLS